MMTGHPPSGARERSATPSEESLGFCVAVWADERWRDHRKCNTCPHPFNCHTDDGCHVIACGCAVNIHAVCLLPLVFEEDGSCMEDGCWSSSADHCSENPETEHLCRPDRAHHPFVPRVIHVGTPQWEHGVKLAPRAERKGTDERSRAADAGDAVESSPQGR